MAEQWARESASSAGELAQQVGTQFENPPSATQRDYAQVFSLTFAIGLIILAFTLMLQIARASRGPVMMAELRDNLPRFVLYVPMMLAVPGLVYMLGDFTHQLGVTFAQQSGASFGQLMGAIGDQLVRNPAQVLDLLSVGPVVALIMLIVFIVVQVLWLIMDVAAAFGVYLLVVALPISAALSLYPSNRTMLSRTIGVLIGVSLVPAVTRAGWWLMWLIQADTLAAGALDLFTMLKLLVIMILAVSSPVLLGYLMPHILPGGGVPSGGMGGAAAVNLGEVGKHVQSSMDFLKQNATGDAPATDGLGSGADAAGGATVSKSATGAGATGSGAGAAGATGAGATGAAGSGAAGGAAGGSAAAGAGASSAAAAAGPVGVAVAAGYEAYNALAGASKSAALGTLAAAGGGHGHDPNATVRMNPKGAHSTSGGGAGPSSTGAEPLGGSGGVVDAGTTSSDGSVPADLGPSGGLPSDPGPIGAVGSPEPPPAPSDAPWMPPSDSGVPDFMPAAPSFAAVGQQPPVSGSFSSGWALPAPVPEAAAPPPIPEPLPWVQS